jgi:hypothetical protein
MSYHSHFRTFNFSFQQTSSCSLGAAWRARLVSAVPWSLLHGLHSKHYKGKTSIVSSLFQDKHRFMYMWFIIIPLTISLLHGVIVFAFILVTKVRGQSHCVRTSPTSKVGFARSYTWWYSLSC